MVLAYLFLFFDCCLLIFFLSSLCFCPAEVLAVAFPVLYYDAVLVAAWAVHEVDLEPYAGIVCVELCRSGEVIDGFFRGRWQLLAASGNLTASGLCRASHGILLPSGSSGFRKRPVGVKERSSFGHCEFIPLVACGGFRRAKVGGGRCTRFQKRALRRSAVLRALASFAICHQVTWSLPQFLL